MNSPVKYYGGKSNMTGILSRMFPSDYTVYVEGFGGGASLLLSEERDGKVEVYNDLGQNVYSLFRVLSDNALFKEFRAKCDLALYSKQLRDEYKESLRGELSTVERAYRFFYVNRASFNGVGGFSVSHYVRRGMCKSVSDFLSAVDGLPALHDRLSRVVVENRDIMEILDKYDHPDTFIYLDPPYVSSTRLSSTKYEEEMSDNDHRAMLEKCTSMKSRIMISGYDNPFYDNILKGWHKVILPSGTVMTDTAEVVWMNYDPPAPKEHGLF